MAARAHQSHKLDSDNRMFSVQIMFDVCRRKYRIYSAVTFDCHIQGQISIKSSNDTPQSTIITVIYTLHINMAENLVHNVSDVHIIVKQQNRLVTCGLPSEQPKTDTPLKSTADSAMITC